jgi:hypothetical protein
MEFMDRYRRAGGVLWVGFGVAFQLGWALYRQVLPGLITVSVCAVIAVLAAAVVSGARGWSVRVAHRVVAVLLGAEFAGAVADRFGVLGAPGTAGVSWGSWTSFVDYTDVLLLGVARPVAVAAAGLATAVEVALSVQLVIGWRPRWVGKGAAALLAVYLTAMTVALGLDPVAAYAVPILVGGALLVSAPPAPADSGDRSPRTDSSRGARVGSPPALRVGGRS